MIRPTQVAAPGAQAQPQFVNSPRYPTAASANTGGAGVPVMHGSIRTASSNVHVPNGQSPPPVYRAPLEASQHPSFSLRQALSPGPPVAQGRPAGGSFVPAAVGGAPAATPIQSYGSYGSPGSFVSPPLPAVNQLLRSPGNSFVAAPPALAFAPGGQFGQAGSFVAPPAGSHAGRSPGPPQGAARFRQPSVQNGHPVRVGAVQEMGTPRAASFGAHQPAVGAGTSNGVQGGQLTLGSYTAAPCSPGIVSGSYAAPPFGGFTGSFVSPAPVDPLSASRHAAVRAGSFVSPAPVDPLSASRHAAVRAGSFVPTPLSPSLGNGPVTVRAGSFVPTPLEPLLSSRTAARAGSSMRYGGDDRSPTRSFVQQGGAPSPGSFATSNSFIGNNGHNVAPCTFLSSGSFVGAPLESVRSAQNEPLSPSRVGGVPRMAPATSPAQRSPHRSPQPNARSNTAPARNFVGRQYQGSVLSTGASRQVPPTDQRPAQRNNPSMRGRLLGPRSGSYNTLPGRTGGASHTGSFTGRNRPGQAMSVDRNPQPKFYRRGGSVALTGNQSPRQIPSWRSSSSNPQGIPSPRTASYIRRGNYANNSDLPPTAPGASATSSRVNQSRFAGPFSPSMRSTPPGYNRPTESPQAEQRSFDDVSAVSGREVASRDLAMAGDIQGEIRAEAPLAAEEQALVPSEAADTPFVVGAPAGPILSQEPQPQPEEQRSSKARIVEEIGKMPLTELNESAPLPILGQSESAHSIIEYPADSKEFGGQPVDVFPAVPETQATEIAAPYAEMPINAFPTENAMGQPVQEFEERPTDPFPVMAEIAPPYAEMPINAFPTENAMEELVQEPEITVEELRRAMGDGPLVVILGGTSFNSPGCYELVQLLAQSMQALVPPSAQFVTGGLCGVQETFARHCGDGSRVHHLLPKGQSSGLPGIDHNAGADLDARMAYSGALGDFYITVEGGPGVAREANDAVARGAVVVPLMRTGGASGGMFKFPTFALEQPTFATKAQWELLASTTAPLEESAAAAAKVLRAAITGETPLEEPMPSIMSTPEPQVDVRDLQELREFPGGTDQPVSFVTVPAVDMFTSLVADAKPDPEAVERAAAEEAAREAEERATAQEAERVEAERAAELHRLLEHSKRVAAESAQRAAAEQAAIEEAREAAERAAAAQEAKRVEAERMEELKNLVEHSKRVAAESAHRIAAEQAAVEENAREAAERSAALEAQRVEAERAAELQYLLQHSKRVAEEAREAQEAERVEAQSQRIAAESAQRAAAEQAAAEEAAREAVMRAREVAERAAAQEAQRIEAERVAELENLLEHSKRVAAESAQRAAAEQAAIEEAREAEERAAAHEAERVEAERAAELQRLLEQSRRVAAESAQRAAAEQAAIEEAREAEERAAAQEAERVEAERAAELQRLLEHSKRVAAESAQRAAAEQAAIEEAREAAERAAAQEVEWVNGEEISELDRQRVESSSPVSTAEDPWRSVVRVQELSSSDSQMRQPAFGDPRANLSEISADTRAWDDQYPAQTDDGVAHMMTRPTMDPLFTQDAAVEYAEPESPIEDASELPIAELPVEAGFRAAEMTALTEQEPRMDIGGGLPLGCHDRPGFVHLPAFSEHLYAGNQVAPACGDFDVVLSTVMPVDLEVKDAPQLTTHAVTIDDFGGQETEEAVQEAARSMVEGASIIANTLQSNQKTLVHCGSGENAALAIACAYAVLCNQWPAREALEYVKMQNLSQRHYGGQNPMSNEVFNGIIHALEQPREDDEAGVGQSDVSANIADTLDSTSGVSDSFVGEGPEA